LTLHYPVFPFDDVVARTCGPACFARHPPPAPGEHGDQYRDRREREQCEEERQNQQRRAGDCRNRGLQPPHRGVALIRGR
jgi:hypothetical protein